MRTSTITGLATALVLASGTAAVSAARAPLYVGTTAKRLPIYLRTTPDGTRLTELRVTWTDSCARSRRRFTALDRTDRVAVRGGTFSTTRRYRESGTGRRVTIFVTGTLGPLASGRFAVRARQGGRTCRTGMMRWSARRVP